MAAPLTTTQFYIVFRPIARQGTDRRRSANGGLTDGPLHWEERLHHRCRQRVRATDRRAVRPRGCRTRVPGRSIAGAARHHGRTGRGGGRDPREHLHRPQQHVELQRRDRPRTRRRPEARRHDQQRRGVGRRALPRHHRRVVAPCALGQSRRLLRARPSGHQRDEGHRWRCDPVHLLDQLARPRTRLHLVRGREGRPHRPVEGDRGRVRARTASAPTA